MKYDHKQAYRWQKKQEKEEFRYSSGYNDDSYHIRKLSTSKYSVLIHFYYIPEDDNISGYKWYYGSYGKIDKKYILFSEKFDYYVRINNKKRIDKVLTGEFILNSKYLGKIELTKTTTVHKGNHIATFDNYIEMNDQQYEQYKMSKRKLKLKRALCK